MIRYSNQGAIRNQPLSPEMRESLSFLSDLGVEMEVFSGGQAPKGSGGPRTGSTRHDHGNAADVFFYKDGRRLDWSNPDDQPVFQEIVRRGKQSGLTGFGAGENYMQPGSMHIGFGNPAVWGAGGKGSNAPDWLRQAYGSAPQPTQSRATVSTQGATDMQQQQKPQGLLGFFANNEESQGPSKRQGPSKLETIGNALMSMSAYPTAGMRAQMRSFQDRKAEYRQDKKTAKQRSKTAAWLRSNGMGQLADGVESGAITGRDALAMARGKDDRTALMKNAEWIMSQNPDMSFDEALQAARSGQTINVGTGQPKPPDDTIFATDNNGNIVYEEVDIGGGRTARRPVTVPLAGTKAESTAIEIQSQQTNAVNQADQMLQTIDSALDDPALGYATGSNYLLGAIPGTGAKRAATKIDQLQGQVFLEAYQRLKGAGVITEIEGQKAEQALARLDRAQSDEDFKSALMELRTTVQTAKKRAELMAGQRAGEMTDQQLLDMYGGD